MSQQAYVTTTQHNHITTVTFYHPAGNSLPAAILQQLGDAIKQAGTDDAAKVIVLRSEGEKVFCAGASFDELVAIKDEVGGKQFFSGFAHVINAIRTCGKLVIGRIQGKAVGGGVGLAAAVDYAFATEQASVKLSELAVGIGPFVVGPAVERKMGLSAFSQLAIDATEWRSAAWAQSNGLYASVHATAQEMDAAIAALAERLSESSPDAMKDLKKIFWQGTEHWDTLLVDRAGVSGRLVLSPFTRNAITKFKGK